MMELLWLGKDNYKNKQIEQKTKELYINMTIRK